MGHVSPGREHAAVTMLFPTLEKHQPMFVLLVQPSSAQTEKVGTTAAASSVSRRSAFHHTVHMGCLCILEAGTMPVHTSAGYQARMHEN